MRLTEVATLAVERASLPDALTRLGVSFFVSRARRQLDAQPPGGDAVFARGMSEHPIADNTDTANAQHYELPAAFFRLVLGPHLKYSSGLYDDGA